jgi:hypothetical protein
MNRFLLRLFPIILVLIICCRLNGETVTNDFSGNQGKERDGIKSTFTPYTSTGGTSKIETEVDALMQYGGGVNYDSTTINSAITAIGSENKAALVLSPGTWTMFSNVTIPSNITFKIVPGASIKTTGYTIAINGPFEAGLYQVFSGSGTVTGLREARPEWWQANTTPGTTDMRAAINCAIQSTNGPVHFRSTTYAVSKGNAQTDEAGDNYAVITMKSNMQIEADKGATIQLLSNQSTDALPVNIAMFFSNVPLSNISFRNIKIDMNGANNGIGSNNYTFAHILFSGTIGGVAAKGDDILIENCEFVNTPGVTCIGMAQSNTARVTLGKRWTIKNCLFDNNGLDSSDHSSVYAYADDVLIDGNTFTADSMAGSTGGQVAYEMHGTNQRFVHNTVKNFYQGAWVSSNITSAAGHGLIANNKFYVSDYGIGFYRETPPETAINDISIIGNYFEITDNFTAAQLKSAISIASTYAVSNILISDNYAIKSGMDESSSFVGISTQSTALQEQKNIKITGNYVKGFTFGIYMTTSTNGIGEVTIIKNDFVDLRRNATFSTNACIHVERLAGSEYIERLIIDNNHFIETSNNTDYGINLVNAYINNLYIGTNTYMGMHTKNFQNTATITNYTADSGFE